MRVIQVNSSVLGGGASNASWRLHTEFKRREMDSRLWSGMSENTASEDVEYIGRHSLIRRVGKRLVQPLGLDFLNITSTFTLHRHPWLDDNTVVHLHNLHGDYFNYLALPRLLWGRTAILTLHDMWAFTGHCAYSADCERWRQSCGKCPYPESYPAIERDNTRLVKILKNWAFGRCKLIVTAPSLWLTQLARQSYLGRFPVHHIPNGIDLDVYRPLDKSAARQELGLPQDKKILLWAANHLSDTRKGGDLLPEIADRLTPAVREKCVLAAFGVGTEDLRGKINLPVFPFGAVYGGARQALLYSAADVLVFPSRSDNLPFVPMEAMACGLPSVGFDIGGVGEVIRDGLTGFLCPAFDAPQFVKLVERVVGDQSLGDRLSGQAHAYAREHFSVSAMADAYLALYQKALGNA